jgi:hypothetical protein
MRRVVYVLQIRGPWRTSDYLGIVASFASFASFASSALFLSVRFQLIALLICRLYVDWKEQTVRPASCRKRCAGGSPT